MRQVVTTCVPNVHVRNLATLLVHSDTGEDAESLNLCERGDRMNVCRRSVHVLRIRHSTVKTGVVARASVTAHDHKTVRIERSSQFLQSERKRRKNESPLAVVVLPVALARELPEREMLCELTAQVNGHLPVTGETAAR